MSIRRALTMPLTLCESIGTGTNPTTITIADVAVGTSNCVPFPVIPGVPAPPMTPALPDAMNYRCKLGAPDANYNVPNPNFCTIAGASPDYDGTLQKVKAVVSDLSGHFRTFTYTGENMTNAPTKYMMTLDPANPISSDARNNVLYEAGKAAVYLIEERTYSLNADGNLTVAVNGGAPSVLIKGITRFKIAAKEYTNTTDKAINPTPINQCTAVNYDSVDLPPTIPTAADPAYSCTFNFNTAVADAARNWKTIAGVKVKIQAKYDPTGRDANPTGALKNKIDEKLSVTAEFFPRNVLSK